MASIDSLVHLNLNFNELQNALLQQVATLPTFTSGQNSGFICFLSTTQRAMLWTGSEWIDLSDIYTHPTFSSGNIPTTPLTGAKVVDKIVVENGHVTEVTSRTLTPSDIGAASSSHTHNFAQIVGLPATTILGNKTTTSGSAQALTVAELMVMLSIAYGNATILNTGTDTAERTWSAKMLTDWITTKLASYLTVVNLAIGSKTTTTVSITNTAGTGVTLPSATSTEAGLLSSTDKSKLDGISANANNYVHPTDNPGSHPFSSELTSGVKVLSQVVVNAGGHVTSIKGRDLTASDLATVLINNASTTATTQTWSASKIYTEVQSAISQAQTGALQYKGEFNPATSTPAITTAGLGVKTGWTYVVSATGTFAGQPVEAGDMIISKVDNPLTTAGNWQIVNKNIPALVSASAVAEGLIMLASQTEAIAGTNNTKAITPFTLKAVLDATVGGYSVDLGDGTNTTFTVTHALNTTDVTIQVQGTSDKRYYLADVSAPTATTVKVSFNRAPTTNQYRVIIKK